MLLLIKATVRSLAIHEYSQRFLHNASNKHFSYYPGSNICLPFQLPVKGTKL